MAMDYNRDPYTTTTTTPPPPVYRQKSHTWTYVAVAVVVLAIVAMFAMPGNQSGVSTTSGTPPAMSDTVAPSATEPMPAPPAPAAAP